ncbi:hypothetical protein SAM19_05218 [Brevibacillus laterosporus]|nr:hypothetical protein [Brevibacillus laterosporus]
MKGPRLAERSKKELFKIEFGFFLNENKGLYYDDKKVIVQYKLYN